MKQQHFQMDTIAVIHSPFKQKFAIPRQPRLVPQAIARLQFLPPYNNPDCLRELQQFSHLWLLFMFHENLQKGWSPTIRPPRLGGNKKVGVFASRATFRPNGIGMSAVQLLGIEKTATGPELILGGIDLLDQTPIIDIKPYIPYSDIVEQANGGFADDSPISDMTVSFSTQAIHDCQQYQQQYPQLPLLIENLLAQDPRPAYRRKEQDQKNYGVDLYDFNVRWRVDGNHSLVLSVEHKACGPLPA